MHGIYDPLEFMNKIELFTIAVIGSFITMKFLDAMHENLYEPFIAMVVDSEQTDGYYIKLGKYYVHADMIIKEFIKWFLLLIILMIIYNVFVHKGT
jgi:hypothetical protein